MTLVLRPSTRQGRWPGSLSLRLIHNRRVKVITIPGCRLFPEEWDRAAQKIVYPEDNPRRACVLEKVESTIFNEVELLNKHLHNLERLGRFSVDDILRLYRERKNEGKLLGYADVLARTLENRGQHRTASAYRTVTRGLVKFNNGDIPLAQINSCLIKDFEKHLREAGKMPNTISYYMRNLRAIYNKAVGEKRVVRRSDNPFAGVYMGVTKTMKRNLTLDEVIRLHELDFDSLRVDNYAGRYAEYDIERLRRCRSYFMFCFLSRGMSFVDLAYLRKDNIRGSFIRYMRRKTGQQMEIRITDEMQAIMDCFSGEVQGSPWVFPILREDEGPLRLQYESALRTQNNRLKQLASLAGISKPLGTHWARHTWATIGKQKNLSIRVLSECLGHTSEKTTRIYLDSLDNSLLDAANEAIISAIARKPMIPRVATGI